MVKGEEGEQETYENAMVRILEQGFEQMAVTTENTRMDYQAIVRMFFQQMDAYRQDSKEWREQMKSMHDDHVAHSKRSHRALYKLTKAHRSSSTRGRFQSDDYSTTSSPSNRKAPSSSKAHGMETPTSHKANYRSVTTERKPPVKDSTNQQSLPVPKKKATAAATVKRAFKPDSVWDPATEADLLDELLPVNMQYKDGNKWQFGKVIRRFPGKIYGLDNAQARKKLISLKVQAPAGAGDHDDEH